MFIRKQIGLNHMNHVAKDLISEFPEAKVFAFYGVMGSGKTTLIQHICQSLQSDDRVTSPTFAIVNEYFTRTGEAIYHFDFYRLKNLEEAYDLGYEDYFFSGNYCLIEWPEKIEPLLPGEYVRVNLTENDSGSREITAVLNHPRF